jgi:hypothetical protein
MLFKGMLSVTDIFQIPGQKEWAGYESDLDVRSAYDLMFGKTNDEIQDLFGESDSIDRSDELLFMPRKAFQYYVFAFAQYVISEKAKGDPDSASSFLNLLICREERDSGSVAHIYPRLVPTVKFIADHQEYFDADLDIYGSFREKALQINALCAVQK